MFSRPQVEQLLRPINTRRVLKDGKGHAHISQQDTLAHLIRMFGFGGFDVNVTLAEVVFEDARTDASGKPTGRWDVCYRARVHLTVRDEEGHECHYDGVSTATAQNQNHGDAHDLAYKSAVSLSTKRAAIHLGDQFGLSLYNKGQTDPLVRGVLVGAAKPDEGADIQKDVPQQLSDGQEDEPTGAPAESARATAADFTKADQ